MALSITPCNGGHVVFGKEDDIIEGRYGVLKVSPGAAELVYLDGRGRQAIQSFRMMHRHGRFVLDVVALATAGARVADSEASRETVR